MRKKGCLMANKKGRRQFGWIRKLPSGRFQASYQGPDGIRHVAPDTFDDKTSASVWLTLRQSELLRGEWASPDRGRIRLDEYAVRWIDDQDIGNRTRGKYRTLLRLHIAPMLGEKELGTITTEVVRRWLAALRNDGRGASTAAGAYRLLRAVMNTAVLDERIRRNPCRIKGADKERTEQRPVASIPQVYTLVDSVEPNYRMLILCAAFTSLRWGELAGLRRQDIDLEKRIIQVRRTLQQLDDGRLVDGPPKSAAGERTVSIPPFVVDDLRDHLTEHVAGGPRGRVFTSRRGGDLRRDIWYKEAGWKDAKKAAGLPEHFHFHDLRHTGNHLASQSGANLRELMRRMGHSSVRAAMIYLHATDERDREIADRLAGLVDEYQRKASGDDPHDDDDGLGGVPVSTA